MMVSVLSAAGLGLGGGLGFESHKLRCLRILFMISSSSITLQNLDGNGSPLSTKLTAKEK